MVIEKYKNKKTGIIVDVFCLQKIGHKNFNEFDEFMNVNCIYEIINENTAMIRIYKSTNPALRPGYSVCVKQGDYFAKYEDEFSHLKLEDLKEMYDLYSNDKLIVDEIKPVSVLIEIDDMIVKITENLLTVSKNDQKLASLDLKTLIR